MKLLSLIVAALPLCVPLGGTVLEFPVDGRADPAKLEAAKARLQFETWNCAKHPLKDPGNVRLPVCSQCGQAMAKVEVDPKTERHLRLSAEEQRLSVVSGPWPGLGLLRQSAVEKAIQDTGLKLRPTGWHLREHVLLEVEAGAKATREDLTKALATFGKTEFDGPGMLVLVRLAEKKGGHDHVVLVAAAKVASYTVKDTLWVMNQCSGELVTAR
jgi:hypothetical protein